MKDKICALLGNINELLKVDNSFDVSLMSGKSGIFLFNYLYGKYFHETANEEETEQSIQTIAEMSLAQLPPTFCSGKVGINWFFTYLNHNGLITEEDRDFLCEDDGEFQEIALSMLDKNNYDFLHGATGIAYYLLYSKTYRNEAFFDDFFNKLLQIFEKSETGKMLPLYNQQEQTLSPNQVNLGLAHGIPSILKLCLKCRQENICNASSEAISLQIVNYLKNHVNADKSKCYLPQYITDNAPNNTPSRLGWCYGDLSLGYILYQAGIILKDEDTVNFSLDILTHTTHRRTPDQTDVFDGGVCHGSAGIAHIYNKISRETNLKIFKEACDFWIAETLRILSETDWNSGYKKFNNYINDYEVSNAFLDGSAGIGLVLLSYLIDDFSWDYALMLN